MKRSLLQYYMFPFHARALCINTDRMAFMSSTTKPMGGRPKLFGTGMVEAIPECGGGGIS